MKTTTYVLMAANSILWGYFIWSGIDGIESVREQHAPGYPNSGQIEFYIAFPVIMFGASLALPLLLRRSKWSGAGTGFLITALLLIFPFGCVYTGGM